MIFRMRKGLSLDETIVAHTVFAESAADIIINNRDVMIDHPYHLRAYRSLPVVEHAFL
jgi:hypothetical protein